MRPQELNLLMVFDAIMTEKSITRAADRLAMTQPAVSNAVSRMRVAWKDELFVKDGRNIQPTLYAQNLWDNIRSPLSQLSEVIDRKEFDPATERRTFRIAVADVLVNMLWVPLRQLFEREAPGIDLHAIPYTIVNNEQVLEDAKVDLVLGAVPSNSGQIRSDYLFTAFYVCVMRKDHPLAKKNLSLEEFAAAEHLLVSLSGDTTGFTDEVLIQHGLSRRVACTVNHFSAIAPLLTNSNLISVVPAGAVIDEILDGSLAATLPPIDLPPTQLQLLWHKRQDRDGGLIWLKQHVKQITVSTASEEIRVVKKHLCQLDPEACSQGAGI